MIEPTQEDIGRRVIYKKGNKTEEETGKITSFNEQNVFVRYGEQMFGSQATYKENLDWLED